MAWQTNFSLAKIKTIMKSSPDTMQISQEAVVAMEKATVFFIEYLAQNAYQSGAHRKRLDYGDLAKFVKSREGSLDFLSDVLPEKMTFKQALEQIEAAGESDPD